MNHRPTDLGKIYYHSWKGKIYHHSWKEDSKISITAKFCGEIL